MDSSLAAHLHAELRLLQDHASLLAYLLCSNQDRQAFVTIALALLDSVIPFRPSFSPPIASDSTQLVGSGDAEHLGFSDFGL